MREQFEKLPEIAERISRVEWDDDIKRYRPRTTDKDTMTCARVNGALYAYQEQQKKIDEVLNLVCKLQYSSGERIYSEVKELLK